MILKIVSFRQSILRRFRPCYALPSGILNMQIDAAIWRHTLADTQEQQI